MTKTLEELEARVGEWPDSYRTMTSLKDEHHTTIREDDAAGVIEDPLAALKASEQRNAELVEALDGMLDYYYLEESPPYKYASKLLKAHKTAEGS